MAKAESARAGSAGDGGIGDALTQLVLERTHDLVTLLDPAGTIVYASPAWETILGRPAESLCGTPVLELVHPGDAAAVSAAVSAVAEGRELDAATFRVLASDGSWIAVEATGTPVAGPDGRIESLMATARDVTEREELRLRVQEIDVLYRLADSIAHATDLDA